MPLAESEFILNEDGSIYHLHLQPEQLAPTIITVGDPDRVSRVSQHFDRIEHKVQKREFVTHTGYIGNKRLSVISTGIGTDNIDIVLNELDALVNIDFQTRTAKEQLTSLDIIRIGTSGCLRSEIPLDSILVSHAAIGMEGLLNFYDRPLNAFERKLQDELLLHFEEEALQLTIQPQVAQASLDWIKAFSKEGWHHGITVTATGFYAPQNRNLRARARYPQLFEVLDRFSFQDLQLTNLEMETAGIFGMANMLGHRAISLNALLANRSLGTFSQQPKQLVDQLIEESLAIIVQTPEIA